MKTKLRIFVFSIVAITVSTFSFAQQTAKERRAEMARVIAKHFTALENSGNLAYDEVEAENDRLQETLAKYRVELIRGKDSFKYKGLYLAQSPDNRLCLASWDTKLGTTMVEYTTMAIYRAVNGQVIAKMIVDSTEDNVGSTLMHYNNISIVKAGNKTIYLCHGLGKGSATLTWQELWAYTIEKNQLVDAKIFPGGKANLFIEFEVAAATHSFPGIQVLENGGRITYPVADAKLKFTGNYNSLLLKDGFYK